MMVSAVATRRSYMIAVYSTTATCSCTSTMLPTPYTTFIIFSILHSASTVRHQISNVPPTAVLPGAAAVS